ncbi:MAG: GrpB family protein [Pseudomonadota bacterium]
MTLSAYDENWPDRADALAAELGRLLGDCLLVCHHIGSTSVPGLSAKPIIDLIPVVTDLGALASCRPALEAARFEWLSAFGLPRRRYIRRDDASGAREVQCHAYAQGDPEIERHLAFRDLLRRDASARAEYSAVKERCARTSKDGAAYCDCKDETVKRLESRALADLRTTA